MFRKKRSASQHRHQLSTSSTQSAQSAATRAFLKSQPSSNSLSSAAAAAALRSLTPTPTPVENVQTKRMLQRKSSISSQPVGSPTLRPTTNGLRRVNSSGSMSARTFRDQSPGRPTSSYSTMSTPAVAPPLPAIPPEYNGRRNQSRRSVSMGPSVWSSNSHTQAAELPRSIKSPVTEPDSPRPVVTPDAGTSSPHQRSESRNSINFSYPMNSRTNSPTIPAGFPDRRDPAIEASHNRRPSAQPNKAGRQQTQTVGPDSPGRVPRPVVTALAAAQAVTGTRNEEPITPPVSSRPVRHREPTAFERSPSWSPASTDVKSRTPVKKPSTLAEDRQPKGHSQSEPIKEPIKEPVNELKSQQQAKALPSEHPPRTQTPPVSEKVLRTPPISPPQLSLTTKSNGELQPSQLRQSSSPGRSAHFPTQLAVASLAADQLHQPPPRSVSPAKSALKARNSSLSPDGRVHGILRPGPPLSELSDATSVASDDGVRPSHRKKPVKVSFDDEAEVVGVAASPPTSPEEVIPESPPGKSKSKTSWFNLHKRKSSPLRSSEVEEFDGVLKPRAALPSFGSVRASKDSARPEPIRQEVNDNLSESSESDDEDQFGSFSNDHAIGNLISQASEEKQKQVQTDNTPSDMHTDTSARDNAGTVEENIPSAESDSEPTFFQKTPLSPLQEVPSEQYLPISPNPYLDPPDITFQPATPEIERGRVSLDEYNDTTEYPRPSVEVERETEGQSEGRRTSYGESASEKVSDESSSIYSDADEGYDGDGFGSINAIVDHETAHSAPEASEPVAAISPSKEKTHGFDEDLIVGGFPETCQVACVDTLEPEDSKPANPNPPALIEPLPISSTNLSLPVQTEEDTTAPPQGGINRASTMPVEVYSIAHVRDGDDFKEVDTRQSEAELKAPNAQQTPRESKRRPEALPPKQREGNGPDAAEMDVNGSGFHIPRRQLSNGSDSSSSFKRIRRSGRGSMGMRLTLRGSQQSSSVPTSPTRSIAPVEAPPLPWGLGAGSMRTTLRGNASRKEKPSFFSTSKPQKGKPAKDPGASFASRFPDSDSDSDTGFQSRRLQRPQRSMSDNDMRPVRGIPRRKGAHDGDSTELEDSSDGERLPASSSKTKTSARQPQPTTVRDPALAAVAISRGMTEEELEQLLNGGSTRKPSLLNRLSMRKSKPVVQRGKLQPHKALTNGAIPEHSQVQATPASPSRLSKKSPQKPSAGSTWPLGADNAEPVDSGIGSTSSASATTQQVPVPQPSNGAAVTGTKAAPHHVFGDSNGLQPAVDDESSNRASDVVIEGSGRKKRFQRLRKVFNIRG
ncbi:hypothetical protein BDV12DRAFT_144030 [Aspergillus spectabilis]